MRATLVISRVNRITCRRVRLEATWFGDFGPHGAHRSIRVAGRPAADPRRAGSRALPPAGPAPVLQGGLVCPRTLRGPACDAPSGSGATHAAEVDVVLARHLAGPVRSGPAGRRRSGLFSGAGQLGAVRRRRGSGGRGASAGEAACSSRRGAGGRNRLLNSRTTVLIPTFLPSGPALGERPRPARGFPYPPCPSKSEQRHRARASPGSGHLGQRPSTMPLPILGHHYVVHVRSHFPRPQNGIRISRQSKTAAKMRGQDFETSACRRASQVAHRITASSAARTMYWK